MNLAIVRLKKKVGGRKRAETVQKDKRENRTYINGYSIA